MFTEFNKKMKQFKRIKHFRINLKANNITEKQHLYVIIEYLKEYNKTKT